MVAKMNRTVSLSDLKEAKHHLDGLGLFAISEVVQDAHNEIMRLRKILSFVPGRIALKAKEDAGYGVKVVAI